MKLINVGAAMLNQTPLDWAGNKASILAAIESARRQGVSVLCLPELCLCGYGCEDAFFSAGLRRTAREVLGELLPATVGMVVTFGLPILHRNSLYNAVCVVADGRVAGYVPKQTLAGSGLHYEPRWFKRWPAGVRDVLTYDGRTYPVGDLHFAIGGIKIGLEICEEAWSSGRRGIALARQGVDIILNPSASHFAFGKHRVRQRFVLEGSRAFGVAYVYANMLGNEAGRVIYDGGAMIATAGRLVAVAPRFGYQPAGVISAVIDVDEIRTARAAQAEPMTPPGPEADVGCVFIDLPLPAIRPEAPAVRPPAWENSEHLEEEEFTRAVALGLCDYLRKTRSRGFVVSLSGGADSSAVACLAALGVHLGCANLGVEAFKERFGLAALREASRPEAIVGETLTCVYQATANSSDATRSAARHLAAALGARYHELDVEPIVQAYVDLVCGVIGRPLTWETDDIVLQNIQARVRAPGAWMLANLNNALLLATSNRSEAAVGYATMDGDTAGGVSPIAGIDKAF
ncbi:MAG: NAD+ synthetase, partial [Planctomycetes bacterium]|nr:NAD+ synthetase [Planctomycetota bacterium]